MALTTDREIEICRKYSAYDDVGIVHCYECPLKKGSHDSWDFRCKGNSHYNRFTKEWEFDYGSN